MRDVLQRLQDSAFAMWVVGSDSIWAYPTILTLHTVGLAIIVGAAFVIDLYVLGIGHDIPLPQMRKTFGFFWAGFAINLASGLVLFAVAAVAKSRQPVFFVKLTLIAIAIVVTTRLRRRAFVTANAAAVSGSARPLAIASLVLWAAAIVAGRLMAYL
jgi:hypothetical protein